MSRKPARVNIAILRQTSVVYFITDEIIALNKATVPLFGTESEGDII